MILSVLNGRRMKAEEVAKLRDGSLVTIRCDPRVKPRKFGTRCFRVSTRNGLKLLISKDQPHYMRTIKERPGEYFYREGGY